MKAVKTLIVRVEKDFVEELDFNGTKIYLDPSFRPEHNAYPYGYVVSVPEHNPKMDGFTFNAQPGDKVYINFGVIMDRDNRLEDNLYSVDDYNALAIVRDGVIMATGEHILIEPMDEEVTGEFVIIPDHLKTKDALKGRVIASNDPEIPNGALVAFEENGMFENTIEGKRMFVMYNSNIQFIYDEK